MTGRTATVGVEFRLESTAVVRPGDTLIVAVAVGAPFDEVKRASQELEARLPGVTVIAINANDLAVYQPDTEGAQP